MKPLAYVTPARILYYVAIAVVGFVLQAIAASIVGEPVATAALIMLMWVLLVIDAKVVPPRVSLVSPFLPGFAWVDLLLFVPIFAVLAFAACTIDQFADRRSFMTVFAIALPLFFVFGIVCLLRMQRWRSES